MSILLLTLSIILQINQELINVDLYFLYLTISRQRIIHQRVSGLYPSSVCPLVEVSFGWTLKPERLPVELAARGAVKGGGGEGGVRMILGALA